MSHAAPGSRPAAASASEGSMNQPGAPSKVSSEVFHLDDLFVGQRFTSGARTLSADEIKSFAREFDPQPFHLDEAAARETFFHGLAASGWHAAAIAMSLMVRGGLPIAGGIIGAGGE